MIAINNGFNLLARAIVNAMVNAMQQRRKTFRILIVALMILASTTVALSDCACSFCLAAGSTLAASSKSPSLSSADISLMGGSQAENGSPFHPEGGPCTVCAHAAAMPSQPLPSPIIASLFFTHLPIIHTLQEVSSSLFRPPKHLC